MGKPTFHPDYGLPDSYRMWALHFAETFGVSEAAKRYRVSTSTIYRWRRRYGLT